MCFVRLEGLYYHYRQRGQRAGGQQSQAVDLLDGVSLEVKRGEVVAILGRSGSGKSTLLNLIAGIDLPQRGRLTIGGENTLQMSEQARTLLRRRHIGFIYQSFNLIDTLTAAENIALVAELNDHHSELVDAKVDHWLEAVGLTAKAQHFPDQLSGGEQQRVAIARALVHRPALLLADEPTGNLDAATGGQILSQLQGMVRDHQTTLLVVTHSLAVAQTADRILTLEQGQLSERQGDFTW
ncbi:ABC transporter ATP-binding protein [Gammaproteobacteria bacterium 54_18_T64]|nr:ABC transporter ATP-binding protein [Gammaproteobacteria bacterium 54_18_T64]